jgi:flagellar biosynthetic protein FlhB
MAEGGDDQDDKTEEPTQKRIDEAIKRGDVVKSQELSTFFILMATMAFLVVGAPGLGRTVTLALKALLGHVAEISVDRGGLSGVYLEVGVIVASGLALPALIFLFAGIAGNMIQHRLVWTLEPLIPKPERLSPASGLKRIFSLENVANFAKGIVKLSVVGVAIWVAVKPELARLDTVIAAEPVAVMALARSLAIKTLMVVLAVMAVVAGLDYLFMRQRWLKRMRMSRQELKEEFKQTEGNPEIKAKIRQLRQARARRRMMQSVPKATVVVTNPTHFAVALLYEEGMAAPQCVAKGTDMVALKIREIAEENAVPVVENPPLARALHATVDIDGFIPEEHYRAVAEVIAFVMKGRRPR